jgi:DNA-binding MarR family transcriptional regulator
MTELFEEMSTLDRLVHEPARLALLTALSVCRRADFMYLLRLTGLTKGNLSTHLSKLEAAGLVRVDKRFVGRRPNTLVALTRRGRATIERHWERLEELRQDSQHWSPDDPSD